MKTDGTTGCSPDRNKPALFGMTLPMLQGVAAEIGLKPFAGRQIADWLYHKDLTRIADMTNLPAAARGILAERFEFGIQPPEHVQVSADGTRKYLYATRGGKFIESAWIPDEGRSTLCVSTQIGCRMGCLFCMTGRQGFQGHLSAGEIVNQLRSLPERAEVSNLVFMGMGEPFDNAAALYDSLDILTAPWGFAMSPRRITVSTVGLVPAMREYLARSRCHLAVSLHSPFDDERGRLMPIQRAHPLREVLDVLREADLERQRRVSFEYILFSGLNDSPRHVKEIARVLNGIRCRINLMRFHPLPGSPFQPSDEATVRAFQQGLMAKGIITTIRRSRGLDIAAACGLLSTRALLKPGE